jgi:hypothetical protein
MIDALVFLLFIVLAFISYKFSFLLWALSMAWLGLATIELLCIWAEKKYPEMFDNDEDK